MAKFFELKACLKTVPVIVLDGTVFPFFEKLEKKLFCIVSNVMDRIYASVAYLLDKQSL